MPPHRGLEHISEHNLAKVVAGTPANHFIYWTGGSYPKQEGSLRSASLELITEVGNPVPVRELLERAGRIDGARGYDPATVRAGVRQHQGSRPTVYLLLRQTADGGFRAVTDIPEPHGFGRAIVAGDLVLAPGSDGVICPPRRDLVSRGWW
jgi:hypothetical protein